MPNIERIKYLRKDATTWSAGSTRAMNTVAVLERVERELGRLPI